MLRTLGLKYLIFSSKPIAETIVISFSYVTSVSNSNETIELLTLSACQTAAGNNRSTLGLAGVALRSGVRSTLGTLWFVDDAATVDLMRDFYQYLKEGMRKAEALRQAQLNQIAAPGSHASIWSSFVLIGNWL